MSGAEFAPSIVVGYVTERGGFYATIEDVPTFTSATGNDVRVPYVEAVRQLSCDDPDDMRVIWRLAALKLCASQEGAMSARFAWQWTTGFGHRWCLLVGAFDASTIWEGARDVDGETAATAALCAHVWGPK